MTICVLLFVLTTLICHQSEPPGIAADEVIGRMLAREIQREALSQGYLGMRPHRFENEPLNKRAELVAAGHCDPDGTKYFEVLSEAGWGAASSRVLRKMLESKPDSSSPSILGKARLTADNYDFSMLGAEQVEGRAELHH